jgi:hypothetical protein
VATDTSWPTTPDDAYTVVVSAGTSDDPTPENEEFERFAELTQRLVHVSKIELKEALREEAES